MLLISQHKIVIAGNHELSFDPNTLEEARDYMRQEGREEDTHKVVITIRLLRDLRDTEQSLNSVVNKEI